MKLSLPTSAYALVPAMVFLVGAAPVPRVTQPSIPSSGDIRLFQSPGRVMVMMRTGSSELIPMIFDTGSDGHSIDRLIVSRERLKRVGTTLEIDGTTGKKRRLPTVALTNLTIGGLEVAQLEAVALDYDRNDAMGIFSPEMFTISLLYLDLSSSLARLVPKTPTALPEGPPTAFVQGIPSVQMIMPDGSTLPAHFDTGFDGALSLPTSMMNTVPLMEPARVVGRFKSISTEGDVYGGRVRGKIRIGPLELVNPKVTFLGELANIGLPIIRQVTLVIDAGGQQNWVWPAGSKPPKLTDPTG